MTRIPNKRADLILLAQQMAAGMAANPSLYPVPPFDPNSLSGESAQLAGTDGEIQVQKAEWMQTAQLGEGQETTLRENVARQRKMARAIHANDPAALAQIQAQIEEPHSFEPPQPEDFTATAQGPGSVGMQYKSGELDATHRVEKFFRFERQIRDLTTGAITEEWGVWQYTTTERKIILVDQPRRMEISYRVVAVNDSGDSMPSNTVIVVL